MSTAVVDGCILYIGFLPIVGVAGTTKINRSGHEIRVVGDHHPMN